MGGHPPVRSIVILRVVSSCVCGCVGRLVRVCVAVGSVCLAPFMCPTCVSRNFPSLLLDFLSSFCFVIGFCCFFVFMYVSGISREKFKYSFLQMFLGPPVGAKSSTLEKMENQKCKSKKKKNESSDNQYVVLDLCFVFFMFWFRTFVFHVFFFMIFRHFNFAHHFRFRQFFFRAFVFS